MGKVWMRDMIGRVVLVCPRTCSMLMPEWPECWVRTCAIRQRELHKVLARSYRHSPLLAPWGLDTSDRQR